MTKTGISAQIVADSINQQGDRLTSLLVTFPRIILAEVNTHRMLSKNTSSSRAIPFKKMVESVQNDPFIPIAWQKHHSGMQGTEYITEQSVVDFKKGVWLNARNKAIQSAEELYYPVRKAKSIYDIEELKGTGVTKQLANRLLEPFMWTTMLITGSKEGWDNFFKLRCPKYSVGNEVYRSKRDAINQEDDEINNRILSGFSELEWLQINEGQAEIHIMDLAEKIYDAMNESAPEKLVDGMWHIPFMSSIDSSKLQSIKGKDITVEMVKISTAMAARTSYTVVGNEKEVDYKKMLGLHDRLIEMRHDSPLEHCAKAMTHDEYYSFQKGFINMDELEVIVENSPANGWCRNYKGFIQYRHLIETGVK